MTSPAHEPAQADFGESAVTGALLSDHPHPRGALRRLTGVAAGAGLIGGALGVIGLVLLAIIYGLPLLVPMAVFLAVLMEPLLLLTVLHPRVTVYEKGLWLQPLVWHPVWVPWTAISRLEDHTLIRRGPARSRRDSKVYTGQLLVVDHGLPLVFLIVGVMAGLGWVRAFGIANHSHLDYSHLHSAIQKYKRRG